jgi:dolichol kinase
MLTIYSASEVLRLSGRNLPLFAHITHIGSTEEERRGIVSSPIWFALGILTTISLFPMEYAVIGVLTLTIGDPVASLVGQSIKNRHQYPFNRSKSVEGTLTGFSVALLVCSLLSDPVISLIGCLGGMIIEALPIPLNDNLTIPLLSALTSMVAGMLLS